MTTVNVLLIDGPCGGRRCEVYAGSRTVLVPARPKIAYNYHVMDIIDCQENHRYMIRQIAGPVVFSFGLYDGFPISDDQNAVVDYIMKRLVAQFPAEVR